MIKPVLKGEALLKNIRAFARSKDHLSLWWLGQSGFLLQYEGTHLLCDPYLSDSLGGQAAKSDLLLTRVTEQAVDPKDLDFIKIVTVSDLQPDHLDVQTLRTLLEINPEMELFVPEAVRAEVAERLQPNPDFVTGLDDNLSENLEEVTILGVAGSPQEERDQDGRCRRLGYVIELGPWMIYHSGDVVPFEGLEERLQAFAIDVALLPIGGRSTETGLADTLTASEAAQLARTIDARLAIPCHYEMFDADTSVVEEFAEACERLGQPFHLLRCGEPWSDRELEDLSAEEAEEDEEEHFDRIGGGGNKSRSGEREAEDY
jgi:L-ascorbate metabolism protein UlaG (beta-lactamase superfamily)